MNEETSVQDIDKGAQEAQDLDTKGRDSLATDDEARKEEGSSLQHLPAATLEPTASCSRRLVPLNSLQTASPVLMSSFTLMRE